ncbi:bactofilin family protein [Endomicrobium proavitum]|uniref:Integral membrane protein CcmA involved in cell shape determination n=1 Tax=Endomicrobium proavitum TaxID=1408281 RepID=A0A0G3WL84_9BACT|nr:polymer-forming cytoskeletal protein [Endomicrobium proavitum]AKL98264.1 Integral membrane protein CcmA involved in cell shape determination [Endomicrobium proavitum]
MISKKSSKNLLDSVETIVGASSFFEGNIKTDKTVRIDGKIIGNIDASGVLIGADARIDGNIKAEIVMVGGTVDGNINASDSVEILSKAKVVGNIKTNIFTIAEGAYFEGKSSMIANEENSEDESK